MQKFKTKIEGYGEKEYNFLCYENTETIEIGDKYIFFFNGIADIQVCDSENVKSEVNKKDRPYNRKVIDLVYRFWKRCYKIKETDFDLSLVS